MMWLSLLLLIVGIVLILFGADKLTDGATGLARRFNVTELVIGLTVVAFGTSLPEFVTSFMSTLKGSSDISIGNIVGSNIFNALMIVGCAAWLSPITISKSTIAKDIPFALLASLVLGVVSVDSLLDNGAPDILSRTDGLVLLGYFSVFMAYTYFISRNKEAGADMQQSVKPQQLMPYWKIFLYIIIGLAGLVIGGNLFVDGASQIAIAMGVSETIVGLTLVAAGTSLPELATSMVAARKGSSAIAIGNVIGSNIFNIFFVMGICATVEPMAVGNISYLDLGLMLASMLLLWGFSYTKRTIERWEGAFLVIIYIAYLGYLIYNV